MSGVRRSARNRGDTGGAREEEEEVPPDAESGGEAEYGDPESPAPEPGGSESSFATGADEEGSLLDRLLARVAAQWRSL